MRNISQQSLAVDVQGLAASNRKQVCCICGREYEGYGNNPDPYKKSGRCCNKCNRDYVIPSRMIELQLGHQGATRRQINLAIRRFRQETQKAMNCDYE